jgi:hypothetical protein
MGPQSRGREQGSDTQSRGYTNDDNGSEYGGGAKSGKGKGGNRGRNDHQIKAGEGGMIFGGMTDQSRDEKKQVGLG